MAHGLWTVVLFAAWILPGLVGHDPWKPDEAYSFGLVHHIVQTGEGLVLKLAGEPFLEKPPLFYLTAATTARLFSPPLALHDAARIATAFYMAATALFVWLTARTLYGVRRAHMAVIVLLGCLGSVMWGHQLITDVALLTGFAIGVYGLARAPTRPVWGGSWLGIGAGIGFMAKGLLAPGVFALVALFMRLFERSWRTRSYAIFIGAAALSVSPWLLWWPLSLHNFSPLLFEEWLWDNNFGRFLGWNNLGPSSEATAYWTVLPWYAFPALPLAGWSLWLSRRGASFHAPIQLVVVVLLTTFSVLLISRNARDLYALPLLLPLALLAVPGIERLPERFCATWYRFNVVGFSVLVVSAWLIWVALEFGVPASLQQMLLRLSPDYEPGFKWWPFVAGLAYTFAWAAVVRFLKASTESAVSLWTVGVCVLWALVMTLFVASIDSRKSYRKVVAELRAVLPPAYECIVTRHVGESERAMLEYFGGLVMFREESAMERSGCRVLLVQTRSAEERGALDPNNTPLWQGGRSGTPAERFLLYHWPATAHRPSSGKD